MFPLVVVDRTASWQNYKIEKRQVGKMASWQNIKLAKWQVGKISS